MCCERSACCDKCGDNHITDVHEFNCAFCKAEHLAQGGLGVSIICPAEHTFCPNCGEQGHSAKSGTCRFQKKCLNVKWHQSLENRGKFDVCSVHKFFQSVHAKAHQAFKSAEDATLEAAADATVNAARGPDSISKRTHVAPGGIRFTTYTSPLANIAGPSRLRYQGLDVEDGEIPDQGRILVLDSQPSAHISDEDSEMAEKGDGTAGNGGDDARFGEFIEDA